MNLETFRTTELKNIVHKRKVFKNYSIKIFISFIILLVLIYFEQSLITKWPNFSYIFSASPFIPLIAVIIFFIKSDKYILSDRERLYLRVYKLANFYKSFVEEPIKLVKDLKIRAKEVSNLISLLKIKQLEGFTFFDNFSEALKHLDLFINNSLIFLEGTEPKTNLRVIEKDLNLYFDLLTRENYLELSRLIKLKNFSEPAKREINIQKISKFIIAFAYFISSILIIIVSALILFYLIKLSREQSIIGGLMISLTLLTIALTAFRDKINSHLSLLFNRLINYFIS